MNQRPPLQLLPRARNAHKGDFGRVILVGGSRGMSGSIALSSIAALRCGSGLVTAAVPDRCLETVAAFHPAIMTIALEDDSQGRFSLNAAANLSSQMSSVDAIGCGPGMTTGPGSVRLVERILHARAVARVFDADAINCLALLGWADPSSATKTNDASFRQTNLVLTPHPGELQRLIGVPPQNHQQQLDGAAKLARRTGAVIVVKGGPTVVVGGQNVASTAKETETICWTNSTGNPGMATAGSGDALTGVIASLLGQGLSAWDAARLGVWIHGRAGDRAAQRCGQAGMTALEIVGELAAAVDAVIHES